MISAAMDPQQIDLWKKQPEGRDLILLIKQSLLTHDQWDRLDVHGLQIEDLIDLSFPNFAEKEVFATFDEWNDRLREAGVSPQFIDRSWSVPEQ